MECQAQKTDLADTIDKESLEPRELYSVVNISKATRTALLQFTDEDASDTFIGLLNDHNQLEQEDEEDSN